MERYVSALSQLSKAKLDEIFERISTLRALVIGDVMLDTYMWGTVDRISPEAPVPVVNITAQESRPGGAANVAFNILEMGAAPVVATMVGKDQNGEILKNLFAAKNLPTSGIQTFSDDRPTTVKTRIMASKHQMLRVDRESVQPLSTQERDSFSAFITERLLPECDLVIFEDYDKGLLSKELISSIVEAAAKSGKPIAVDPKKVNFNHYSGVTLFKPNLRELSEGLKIELNAATPIAELARIADTYRKQINASYILLTLSERGILLVANEEYYHAPAHVRNIFDVSGAGDSVISVAALALAAGADIQTATELANLAGGLVCEKVGVVPISINELKKEAFRLNSAN